MKNLGHKRLIDIIARPWPRPFPHYMPWKGAEGKSERSLLEKIAFLYQCGQGSHKVRITSVKVIGCKNTIRKVLWNKER